MRAPVVCLVLRLTLYFGPLVLLSHASLQENNFLEDAERSISALSVLEQYALARATTLTNRIARKNSSARKDRRALRRAFPSLLSLVVATVAGCAPLAGSPGPVLKHNNLHRVLLLATRKVDTKDGVGGTFAAAPFFFLSRLAAAGRAHQPVVGNVISRLEDTVLGKSLGGAADSKLLDRQGRLDGGVGRLSTASWAGARMRAPVFASGFRHSWGRGGPNVVPQGILRKTTHKTPQTVPRTKRNAVQGNSPSLSTGPRVPPATLETLMELTSDLLRDHAIDPSFDAIDPSFCCAATWTVAAQENFPNLEKPLYVERHLYSDLYSTGEQDADRSNPEQFGIGAG